MSIIDSLNNINTDYIKKLQETQIQAQTQTTSSNIVHGLYWDVGGSEAKGRAQNTAVFQGLDTSTQEAIKQAIGDEAWVRPETLAKATGGVVGKANINGEDAYYVEYTAKDGQTSRIWDIGSDNGIGTQDIDFNGAIGDFKEEINASAVKNDDSNANTNINNTSVNSLAKNHLAFVRKNGLDKKNSLSSQYNSTEKVEIIKQLENYLRLLGYTDSHEIDQKVEELLPYYINNYSNSTYSY